jgi:hypothetical protein
VEAWDLRQALGADRERFGADITPSGTKELRLREKSRFGEQRRFVYPFVIDTTDCVSCAVIKKGHDSLPFKYPPVPDLP